MTKPKPFEYGIERVTNTPKPSANTSLHCHRISKPGNHVTKDEQQ
jgi:hypothetical protein